MLTICSIRIHQSSVYIHVYVSPFVQRAQLHVETQNNKRARTESKQVLQMQQDIDTLQSKVEKLVQQDKQRQSDNNEYFEKVRIDLK